MSDQLEVTLKQLNNEIATVQRLNEVQTKFTANFTHEIKTLLAIIYTMLELSKLKSGELPLNKQVSDLAEIIYTTLESFEVTLQKKKLRIDNQIENEGPLINEDKITHLFEAFYQADHSRKEEGTG